MTFYFHLRKKHKGCPAGTTVTKRPELPKGNFRITEYHFGPAASLWFLDKDHFTADERQKAFELAFARRGSKR
jgi:hypothetical protein